MLLYSVNTMVMQDVPINSDDMKLPHILQNTKKYLVIVFSGKSCTVCTAKEDMEFL